MSDWRKTGEMPDPNEVSPDDINTATGHPHSEDARLYAQRDQAAPRLEQRARDHRRGVQQSLSRRDAGSN